MHGILPRKLLIFAIYRSLNLDHKLLTLEYIDTYIFLYDWKPNGISKIYKRFWFSGQLIIKSFKLTTEIRNKKQQKGHFFGFLFLFPPFFVCLLCNPEHLSFSFADKNNHKISETIVDPCILFLSSGKVFFMYVAAFVSEGLR